MGAGDGSGTEALGALEWGEVDWGAHVSAKLSLRPPRLLWDAASGLQPEEKEDPNDLHNSLP